MELKENQRPIAHLKTWYKIDAMLDTGDKKSYYSRLEWKTACAGAVRINECLSWGQIRNDKE